MSDEWQKISPNLCLHTPSGYYYVRKSRKGKGRLFKSTGEKRKLMAQSKADAMVAEWMTEKKGNRDRYSLVSDILDDLDTKLSGEADAGGRAKKTREHDKYYLRLMKEYFGSAPLISIDEAFWSHWVTTKGRKLNRKLGDMSKYLSKVLTYALENGLIDRKPEIENPDEKPGAPPIYTREQVKALLDAADPVLHDLIMIGFETGLRPFENRRLQWDMIVFTKESVKLELPAWFTKTRTSRELIVGPESARILRERYRERDETSPFVFRSFKDPKKPINENIFSRKWRKTVLAAGLPPGAKFHHLRHTFFTTVLLEAGKDLPMVAAYGGNSPKILFDRYMSKQAERTKSIAGSVSLGFVKEKVSGGKKVDR